MQIAAMSISITIRDVPRDVRDTLAARAARTGRSLQEHLRAELIELARQPAVDEVMARAQRRVEATKSRLSAKQILAFRDADRR
jgi:plasmid stability protein